MNLADFRHTVQNSEEKKDGVCSILSHTRKHKMKQTEIIILSDDTDSEIQIVCISKKRKKLRKRKAISISKETGCKDDTILKNMLPGKTVKNCEALLNVCAVGQEGNVKLTGHYQDPNKAEAECQDLCYSSQCHQKPKQKNSINIRLPISKSILQEDHCPVKKEEFHEVVDPTAISEKIKYIDVRSANWFELSLNVDISVAIHEEEKFYSRVNNAIIISDEENFDEYKPNELANIRKEWTDACTEKDSSDISALSGEKKSEGSLLKKDDTSGVSLKDESEVEMPLSDTDDIFDYGDDTDCNIEEKKLLDRLVWPSTPDEENISCSQLSETSNLGEANVEIKNEDAEKVATSKMNDISSLQITSAKSPDRSDKMITALPMRKPGNTPPKSTLLQDRMKPEMHYLMSSSGGGSAVRKDYRSKSENLKKISSSNVNKAWSKIIQETVNKLPPADSDVHNLDKNKANYSMPAVQRFTSRGDLLLKSMLQSDSSVCVNKTKVRR